MYKPSNTMLAVVGLLIATVVYLWRLLRWYRIEQFKRYPRIQPDPIWGHLKMMGEAFKRVPKGAHSDYCWELCREENDPTAPFLQFDMRPALAWPINVICSHAVAEECSKPSKLYRYSLHKSPTTWALTPLIGDSSILLLHDDEWKSMRKAFNPGYAPAHLNSLLPLIVDRTKRFLARMERQAETEEVFELEELTTNLTFDIIGAVSLNMDMNAQAEPQARHPLVHGYGNLLSMFNAGSAAAIPLPRPIHKYKRNKIARQVNFEVKKAVQKAFDDMKNKKDIGDATDGRSVVELALRDVDDLTPQKLQETADQVKTFMFAGHDTTATLLQNIFYMLSLHPKVQETLTKELDEVFGLDTSPNKIAEQLLQRGEEATRQLQYTSAIIKETLRVWPPAGSARIVPKEDAFTVTDPRTGEQVPLYGIVYLCHWLIQRDEAVYGPTAKQWIPERWLGNTDTSMDDGSTTEKTDGASIPTSAWRPFERGPRNCIGQELANIEARVIIACTARHYRFEKVGIGEKVWDENGNGVLNDLGVYKTQTAMYAKHRVTSKPVDGMRGRLSFAR